MRKSTFFAFPLILLTLSTTLLSGCNPAKYTTLSQGPAGGVDFRTGNWLLLEIDCPPEVYGALNTAIQTDFKAILGDRLYFPHQIQSAIIPKDAKVQMKLTALKQLALGVPTCDYVILCKAVIARDEMGLLNYNSRFQQTQKQNMAHVTLECYDLKKQTLLYSKRFTGSSTSTSLHGGERWEFSVQARSLLLKAYEKGIKDLRRTSVR